MLCLSLSRPKGTARQGGRGPLWARPLNWQGSTADSNKTAQPQESGGRVRAAGSRSQEEGTFYRVSPHLDQVRTPLSFGQEKVPLDPGNLCAVSFFARLARFVRVVACLFVRGGGAGGAWSRGGGELDEADRSAGVKFEGRAGALGRRGERERRPHDGGERGRASGPTRPAGAAARTTGEDAPRRRPSWPVGAASLRGRGRV